MRTPAAILFAAILVASAWGCTATAPQSPSIVPSESTPVSGTPTVVASPPSTSASTAPSQPSGTPAPLEASGVDVIEPSALSAYGSTIWAIAGSDVATVDTMANTSRFLNIGNGGELDGVYASQSAVWVAAFDGSRLLKVDPVTDQIVDRITMPTAEDVIQVGTDVWVSNHHSGTLTVVNSASDAITDTVSAGMTGSSGPQRLAFGAGSIWVGVGNTNQVVRVDPKTHNVVANIQTTGFLPCGGIAATDLAVWITACHEQKSIARIDVATNALATVIDLDGYGQLPVVVGDYIWVAVPGELERIDPQTNMVDLRLSFPALKDVGDSIIVGDSLWIADATNTIFRVPLAELPS